MASQLPVICIMGPTASGKSSLAEKIAARIDGEIISADSMQIYRGMDIGTAKQPVEERGVPYHCIDILDPGEPYSAAQFQTDSRAAIEDIRARGKNPIICGGTFLYVRACIRDMEFAAGEQVGNEIRDRYTALWNEKGPEAVYEALKQIDPASAESIHPNNTIRVIRALEMAAEGESYAERKDAFKTVGNYYDALLLGLQVDTDILYERIDRRVDQMVEEGLIGEVEGLLSHGFREGVTAQAAIGYKEIVEAMDGGCSMEEAIASIKQATRRYSKRQRSWLRSEADLKWLGANRGITEDVVAEALRLIEGSTL